MIRISRLSAWLFAVAGCCLSCNMVGADETGNSSGLTTLWQSQVMIDGARDKVAEMHLHVHDDRAISYFEILYPGFRDTVAFDDLNPRGVPFRDVYPDEPERGAREWAELKKEILEAKGKTDVTITLITVPSATLYAMTGDGGITAIDAETGQTRWTTRVGGRFDPTIGIASNNTRVIAVRGSRVYCLNAMTGDVIWSRYSYYAPGGGVSVSDHFAYVTSIEGRLQMFPMNETGMPESFFSSTGAATFDPVVTSKTVSWPTERGYFNVARSNIVSLRYRLETNDKFESAGAAVGEYLIANSVDGKVYAMAEEHGTLEWEFAAGERLAKKPIAVGNQAVMIITGNNSLIALDAHRGSILAGWPKSIPGISEYVGLSQDQLYFLDINGRLLGLSRKSGATVSVTNVGSSTLAIPNHLTDRLYLTNPGGAVVCLREIANINPVVMGEEFEVGNAAAEVGQTEPDEPAKKKMELKDPNNPFSDAGEAADMDEEKADQDDPFADDPFAEDDKSADDKKDDKKDDDDPFGDG